MYRIGGHKIGFQRDIFTRKFVIPASWDLLFFVYILFNAEIFVGFEINDKPEQTIVSQVTNKWKPNLCGEHLNVKT